MDFLCGKPLLQYPCTWTYQVIGTNAEIIRDAVARIVGETDYSLTYSNTSRTGKYCSLRLRLVVETETHRDRIFVALRDHPEVRAVM
jgi:putative lipoic acid-binding regulatory protein